MREENDEDRLIGAIARELRKPVSFSPEVEQRVRNRIRGTEPEPKSATGTRWVAGLALAAGLAALALFFPKGDQAASEQGVEFVLEAPGASRVTLVGDFNNWDPAATPLALTAPNGQWRAVVPLEPGRYQFTFVVDGTRWVADPALPPAMGDDFGHPSSVITVVRSSKS